MSLAFSRGQYNRLLAFQKTHAVQRGQATQRIASRPLRWLHITAMMRPGGVPKPLGVACRPAKTAAEKESVGCGLRRADEAGSGADGEAHIDSAAPACLDKAHQRQHPKRTRHTQATGRVINSTSGPRNAMAARLTAARLLDHSTGAVAVPQSDSLPSVAYEKTAAALARLEFQPARGYRNQPSMDSRLRP